MYRINKTLNQITRLEERQFRDLGFKERDHLQEWIAKNPEVLGEELLIIQKEYDGFNDTNERLDLLALDKDGGLVVIENKLDDSGKDVVWQALKYTSYCSTLTTDHILRIFQEYLNKYESGEDAKERILEFLDQDDDVDLLLNNNDQRIMFIANNYRKEVTSTALWLLNHDILLQCFRATPFSLGEELFLNIEQIIPLPETAEYMIDAKEKEKEKKGKSKNVEETRRQLVAFWSRLQENLAKSGFHHADNTNVRPMFYFGFSHLGERFYFALGRKAIRVEFYCSSDEDKRKIDAMLSFKHELESSIPNIEFQRLEGKKASRIRLDMTKAERATIDGRWREDTWPEYITWCTQSMMHFHSVLAPCWAKAKKTIS
jgi:hypothetical protein